MRIDYLSDTSEMTQTDRDGIKSSLEMICSTPYGTAPYMRDMGLTAYLPDDNSPIAKNRHASEVIEQVQQWEDRVNIREIRYSEGNEMEVVLSNDGY